MELQTPYRGEIYVATHFFAIVPKDFKVREAVYKFAQPLLDTKWEFDPVLRKQVRVAGEVWGGHLADFSMFRYPISLLPKMRLMLQRFGIEESDIRTVYLQRYEPAKASITIKENFRLRDYQQEAVDFVEEWRIRQAPSVLLSMPTGSGKTCVLFFYAAQLGLRTSIVVSPAYVEKWKEDVSAYTHTPKDRVYTVQGRKSIQKLFDMCKVDTFDYDFTIFSIATLQQFFKEYEEAPEATVEIYGGSPMDLWRDMKCGFLGGDEMHERLNTVYWFNTFLHGPFHLGLSATMRHKDEFVEERQREIYPTSKRFDKIKMKKYINFIYLSYAFQDFEKSKIRTTFPGKSTYAQNAYEQSIMSSKRSRQNFVDMIVGVVGDYFVNRKQPGDKLAIYFSRIPMINMIVEELRAAYPQLDVQRYAEDDDYSVVINAEVRVTNRGKAGTAVDIPDLTTVINFTNVDSEQAVLQLLGRLREIKDRDVVFVQMYCKNIKKHRQYKDSAREMILERVKNMAEHYYPMPL